MKRSFLIGVVMMSCSFGARAQPADKVLPADKILKLMPDKIKEFYQSSDPKSKLIKFGTLQYSMAEKVFSASRKRSIKILLFDYKEAPIMYNQATRKWSTFTTIESESLIQRPTVTKDCTGWESYNVQRGNSQILLGVCDRFFLTIEGTNIDLEFLTKVVGEFKFETFPRLGICPSVPAYR